MKPISKTFKFPGDQTLLVDNDGYEWCGKRLSEHETTILDGLAILFDEDYLFDTALEKFLDTWVPWDIRRQIVRFVRRNWEWKKGS